MERGNCKLSPRVEEQMRQDLLGTVLGIAGGRAEEGKTAAPAGEDRAGPTTMIDTANDITPDAV
jgi:hypothetical protein